MSLKPSNWKDAIDVQDACNASGVLSSLYELMPLIWEDVRDPTKDDAAQDGRRQFNTHPIVRMFVYKLFQLAFAEPIGDASFAMIDLSYTMAYKACKEQSHGS